MDWMKQANCKGVDSNLFFPKRGTESDRFIKQAVAYCNECPVVEQCLEYALDTDQKIGIWGGTSGRQRRMIQRMRKTIAK